MPTDREKPINVRASWTHGARLVRFGLALAGLVLASPPSHAQVGGEVRGRVVDVLDPPCFTAQKWADLPPVELPAGALLAVGDLDGDGKAEVLVQHAPKSLVVLRRTDNAVPEVRTIEIPRASMRLVGSGDDRGEGRSAIFLWDTYHQGLIIGRLGPTGAVQWEEPRKVSKPFLIDAVAAHWPKSSDHPELLFHPLNSRSVFTLQGQELQAVDRLAPKGLGLRANSRLSYAFGDVDGDGAFDVIGGWSRGGTESLLVTGVSPLTRQFASLPEPVRAIDFVALDLNGDHRTDVLSVVRPRSPVGWFAVYSTGTTGVEVSVERPGPDCLEGSTLRSGDINGDGMDDLVGECVVKSPASTHVELWLMERRMPRGLAGITVEQGDGGARVVTDESGGFVLSVPSPGAGAIKFSRPDFVFGPADVSLSLAARSRRPLIVAGENLKAQPGRAGGILGDPPGPYLCLGYHAKQPAKESRDDGVPWLDTEMLRWTPVATECPDGYAVFNVYKLSRDLQGRVRRAMQGSCCRLPERDILEGPSFSAFDACPSNAIVTGFDPAYHDGAIHPQLRCTRINTNRYQLSTPFPGSFWGFSFGMRGEGHRMPAAQIPAAARPGIGRESWNGGTTAGCIGGPRVGVLLDVSGESCEAHRFAELQDRSSGTVVQMFPNCTQVDDPYNPLSGCR